MFTFNIFESFHLQMFAWCLRIALASLKTSFVIYFSFIRSRTFCRAGTVTYIHLKRMEISYLWSMLINKSFTQSFMIHARCCYIKYSPKTFILINSSWWSVNGNDFWSLCFKADAFVHMNPSLLLTDLVWLMDELSLMMEGIILEMHFTFNHLTELH